MVGGRLIGIGGRLFGIGGSLVGGVRSGGCQDLVPESVGRRLGGPWAVPVSSGFFHLPSPDPVVPSRARISGALGVHTTRAGAVPHR